MSKRSNGVRGSNYLTHIARADERTLCGRPVAKVNCQGVGEEISEGTCRQCAAKAKAVSK